MRGDRALTVVRDELEVERAVGMEYLDAVVVGVGHRDAAVERNTHILRVGELAVAVAAPAVGLAHLEVERAVGMEYLDAVVEVVDSRDAAVNGRDGDGDQVVELAVAVAAPAEREGVRHVARGRDAED